MWVAAGRDISIQWPLCKVPKNATLALGCIASTINMIRPCLSISFFGPGPIPIWLGVLGGSTLLAPCKIVPACKAPLSYHRVYINKY